MGNVEALPQAMVLGMIPGPLMPETKRVIFRVRVSVHFLEATALACTSCSVDGIKILLETLQSLLFIVSL